VTYMEKTQVYLRKEELDALRKAAARSGRSVAELVRYAIRKGTDVIVVSRLCVTTSRDQARESRGR